MNTSTSVKEQRGLYRLEGISEFRTFYVPILIGMFLLLFCSQFPTAIKKGSFHLGDILLPSCIIVGAIIIVFLSLFFILKSLYKTSYLQIDSDGIKGKVQENKEYFYKWEDIKSIDCIRSHIIIITEYGTFKYKYPMLFNCNKDLLLALHSFGGEQILSTKQIEMIQRSRIKTYAMITFFVAIYAIIVSSEKKSELYDYSVEDVIIDKKDVYAVGCMSKNSIDNSQPVLWKNKEITVLGHIGDFNTACRVAVMGNQPYIYCNIDNEKVVLNNKDRIFTFPKEKNISILSMVAEDDSLYICGCYNNTPNDTSYIIWKHIKGETDFVYMKKENVTSFIWNKLQSNKVLYKMEYVAQKHRKSGKLNFGKTYTTRYIHPFSIKNVGNVWCILESGKADVKCEDGAIMTSPIIRRYEEKNHPHIINN